MEQSVKESVVKTLYSLLFLIYVNDLPLEIKKAIIDKFADDTTVSVSPVEQVADDLNE